MKTGIATFDLMRARLSWLERRQGVLAQNVANADTPGYRPRDVAPFVVPTAMAPIHHPGHLPLAGGAEGMVDGQRTETRPNGNAVSLEDEMLRIAEVQVEHQTLAGLYQRSLALLKTSIGRKG